jgi:hypothetical protein
MKRGQRKAQAQIITVVLIILIVIGGILIVWNVVKRTVEENSEQVGTEALMIKLEIKKAQAGAGGGLEVEVHRGVGKGNISELKFILEDENGQTYTETVSEDLPDELETKIYSIFLSSLDDAVEVKKISVVPVVGDKFGIEAEKNVDLTISTMTGLVSWWKFDDNLLDSVGNNDGTVHGNPQFVSGKKRQALEFDGDGDYIDCSNPFNYNELTISAWAYISSDPNAWKAVVSNDDNSDGFYLGLTPTDEWIAYLRASGSRGGVIRNIDSGDYGKWNHLILTWNGTTNKLYFNGAEQGSEEDTVGSSGSNVRIGDSPGYSNDWLGKIDEVMIFNRSLSATEIQALYNS